MSRGWRADAVRTRIYLALRAAGPDGLRCHQVAARVPGVDARVQEQMLYQLKREGWIAQTAGKGSCYVVVGTREPPIDGAALEHAARAARAGQAGQMLQASDVLALIDATPAGLDCDALARQLGITAQAVDALLAEHVASHRLVSCAVRRQVHGTLEQSTLYRTSKAGSSSLADVRIAACGAATAPLQAGAALDDGELADCSLLSEFEPATPAALAAATETAPADELLEAAAPTLALPVFECDIDAVHRKVQSGAAAVAAADAGSSDDGMQFLAALYSDGTLWFQLGNGRQVDLQPEETREFFAWLDRLGGTSLVDRLPAEVA